MIKPNTFTMTKNFAVTVSTFHEDGEQMFSPSIVLFVYQEDKDVVYDLPLFLEIATDTLSEAVYQAFTVGRAFSESFYDSVPVFDLDTDEQVGEVSMKSIIEKISEEISQHVDVPQGTVFH